MLSITRTAWTAKEQNHILNLFHQWNIWFKACQHCLTFFFFFSKFRGFILSPVSVCLSPPQQWPWPQPRCATLPPGFGRPGTPYCGRLNTPACTPGSRDERCSGGHTSGSEKKLQIVWDSFEWQRMCAGPHEVQWQCLCRDISNIEA